MAQDFKVAQGDESTMPAWNTTEAFMSFDVVLVPSSFEGARWQFFTLMISVRSGMKLHSVRMDDKGLFDFKGKDIEIGADTVSLPGLVEQVMPISGVNINNKINALLYKDQGSFEPIEADKPEQILITHGQVMVTRCSGVDERLWVGNFQPPL